MRTTPEHITELKPNEIFVFGSNIKGVHGLGAAKQAVKWGAKYGHGEGLMGQTYALPTKDENIKTLPLKDIIKHVGNFVKVVEDNPQLTFLVTPVGTGLAGYFPVVMANLFKKLLKYENVYLPKLFIDCYEDYDDMWNNLKKFETPDDIPDIPRCDNDYYIKKLIGAGAIPLNELEDGEFYYGKCRNADIAKWDANKQKFFYWRHKFYDVYEEDINHFENDNGYDLFVPIKKVTEEEFNKTK